ncbi:MAG: AsmA family protein [Proteobacteria bacterium]|nr:AsmA family protein [Pseudomonadota bacterium]
MSVALAVGIALLLYNPGLFKGPLENHLSKLSGYSVSFDGDMEISAGRSLELVLTDVRLSNPQWENEEALLVLGSLRLLLDSASLFGDTLIIESLQIADLDIKLETNAEGANNWEPGKKTEKKASPENSDKGHEPAVMFNRLKFSNTTLVYIDAEMGRKQELHIASFDQRQQADGMLQINLDGSLNQRLVEYVGFIGPYKNLMVGEDIAFSGSGHFGSLSLVVDGLIDDLLEPRRPQFKIDLQGPDTDDITGMLGVDSLGVGEFSLRARGETVDGQYTAGLYGSVGDLTINIAAEASDLLELDAVDLSLAIHGPSLGSVTRIFGVKNWPDKPFSIKAEASRVGTTLNLPDLHMNIGGAELRLDAVLTNFPNLDASRINLSIEGDDIVQFRQLLGISGLATGAFSIHGKLDVSDENLELIQLDLKTSIGQAVLSGVLGPGPDYIGTKLHVNMDGDDANLFMSALGVDVLPQQPFKLDARVELLEEGLLVKRGILLSIDDDRLELGGLIAFNPGGAGSNFDFSLSGGNLSEMLGRLGAGLEMPAKPYQLSSRVRLLNEGIELENFKTEFEAVQFAAGGLIIPGNQLAGSTVDFEITGNNLSALKRFPAIGDSIDIFVPGQAYRLGGRVAIVDSSWQLKKIIGKVGTTDIAIDSQLTPQDNWVGSSAQFSIKGPDFHGLIVDQGKSSLSQGSFASSGSLTLAANTLSISELSFNTDTTQGAVNLQLGWPFNTSKNIQYDVDLQGDDIRHLIPELKAFQPALATYKIRVKGESSDGHISMQKFEASIGDLQLFLRGEVGDDPLEDNVDVAIRAVTEDISTLGHLNGELLPALALDLAVDFDGNANEFSIRNINGSLGESHFSGELTVSLLGTRPEIKLDINLSRFDLRPFLLADEPTEASPEAIAEAGNNNGSSQRMIPATPLPLDLLKQIDAQLKLNINELEYQQGSLRDLLFEAELVDGVLDIPRVTALGPYGSFNAAVSLQPTGKDKATIKINLDVSGLRLNLFGQLEEDLDQMPALDLNLKIQGNGRDLQELAGSLNGSVQMGSKGGVLKGVNLSILDTFFFEELAKLIMPNSGKSEDLEITCAAARVNFTDGLLETAPAVAFTTNKITLLARGQLDLKSEKIQFNFNTIPNKAYKFSAGELINPFILVGGTLKKPSVGVDPAKALVRGGLAVGTAGISILAKGALDRLANTEPLCEQMLEQMQER